MSAELAHWLTEHRTLLLTRWASAVEVLSNRNGLSVAVASEGHAAVPSEDALLHGDDSVCYQAVTQDGDIATVLEHIYTGLLLAARGDASMLDTQVRTINAINRQHDIKLPSVLKMVFQLRHLVWEVLRQDDTDHADPMHTVAMMDEFSTLIETLVEDLACDITEHAEKDVQDRIERAEFVAQSMAIAMEEADKTTLKLSLLNRVSQRLAASLDATDSAELIELVGNSLLALLDVAHISIWLPDVAEEQQIVENYPTTRATTLSLCRSWGSEAIPHDGMQVTIDQDASLPPDDIVLQCYQQARVVCETSLDAETQGAWYQHEYGVLALPLPVKEKERAAGVVLLQDPDPLTSFSRAHQDLAMAVVSQAAISLENAHLYEEIRRFNSELGQVVEQRTHEVKAEKERLSTIHEIATEVSSTLDLDILLQTSLHALARITKVEYGTIMLMNYDSDLMVSRAALGGKQVNTFSKIPIGMGVPGWVAQHREAAIVQDVQQDKRWFALPMSHGEIVQQRGSLISVPLIAHNELLGVLTLSHEEPGYFNEGHLRLLSASAGAISMGIHNANMYNTIVAEMERSSELLSRQRSEASKTQSILQSLSDGVLVCDIDGAVILSNPAASRILQWSLEELFLASNLHELLQQILDQRADLLPLKDLLEHPLDSEREPRIFEMIVQVGTRDVQLTLNPVLNEFGELLGAMLMIRDVSREREYDRLRNEFISTMSHELRTPMTAIKGFTQLLAMGGLGPVNDTQREFLHTIQSNAERMISIINDVLDITKIETGTIELEWRSIHLAEVLSSVVSELQEIKKARAHTLTISIPPGLPLLRCDISRLHQVLHNLLSNAFKYTPNGGHVSVEAHEAEPDDLPEHVRNCARWGTRYVQVNIRDTGVGINAEELDRVFERFYRTENPLKIEAGGTGLGLSLVKPLIELFGGFIWVTSVLSEGSTFSFILPTP